jgi:hypothetical protein
MNDRNEMIGVCVDRAGWRQGPRIAQFVTEWEVCVRKNGGPISTDEFASWWHESRPTAYRRLAEFRVAFPELGEHAFPHDLMRPLLDRQAVRAET